MPHEEPSTLLATAEAVHWSGLTFMAIVYAIRVYWLFQFKNSRDRQKPGDLGSRSLAVPLYSMLNVAMPWGMESTRRAPLFYASFVVFHLGVTAGIFFAVFGSLFPSLFQVPVMAYIIEIMMTAAFLVAVGRMVRRLYLPHLRLISTPDDYFSLATLTVWFFIGPFAQAHMAGVPVALGEGWLVAYLFATAFFLVYVPFSKISHYLYYPFTRYWLGKTLGHRGSMSIG